MNEVCDKCLKCHYYSDDVLEECKGQDKPCHEFSEGIAYRQWKLTGIANEWLEQRSHISGDLISRKALLKQFFISDSGSRIPEYDVDNFPITIPIKDVKDIIRKSPTVFDYGKVIEELKRRRDCYDMNEEPLNAIGSKEYIRECADIREHKGKWIAYDEAIKVVEKGGTE